MQDIVKVKKRRENTRKTLKKFKKSVQKLDKGLYISYN